MNFTKTHINNELHDIISLMNKLEKTKKCFIAMSGGVDSSVAAYLLVQQGYKCTGVYMKLFNDKEYNNKIKDIKIICQRLNIPLKIYDFRKQFKQKVIEIFISDYKNGITPNPCIICNSEIKFGLFLDKALKDGADLIATGHYAKIKFNKSKSIYSLYKGKDEQKDQSYFLYRLNQKQLSRTLFPLSNYNKVDVIGIAKKLNIINPQTKESQEICFLANTNLQKFLKKYIKVGKGKILNIKKQELGNHHGYFNYTIGQREGLGIGGGTPYYVIRINAKKNQVIVAKGKNNKRLFRNKIQINKINWIKGKNPKLPLKCKVSIRYNHKPVNATFKKESNRYFTYFHTPQRAPTSGQSAVFYKGDKCLGGGIIMY